MYLKSKV
jgi:hypothetical protein